MTTTDDKRVEFDGESFCVDATLLAESFGITTARVQALMRSGRIRSRCERGIDQDAGLHRLLFLHGALRLSLIVDELGHVLDRRVDATV